MVFSYPFLPIVLVRVTPTAKRNTYSVARLVGLLPRVADFARNPGLGKRNSVRVARDAYHVPKCMANIYLGGNGVSPSWMVHSLGNSVGVAIS